MTEIQEKNSTETKPGHRVHLNSKRWASYAAAGTASLFCAASAEADIHHFVIGSPAGDVTGLNSYKNFAIGDQGPLSLLGFGRSFYSNSYYGFGNLGANVGVLTDPPGNNVEIGSIAGTNVYASNLAAGENISTQNFVQQAAMILSTNFYSYGYHVGSGGQFIDQGGYVAFRFENRNGFGTQYGWAQIFKY